MRNQLNWEGKLHLLFYLILKCLTGSVTFRLHSILIEWYQIFSRFWQKNSGVIFETVWLQNTAAFSTFVLLFFSRKVSVSSMLIVFITNVVSYLTNISFYCKSFVIYLLNQICYETQLNLGEIQHNFR